MRHLLLAFATVIVTAFPLASASAGQLEDAMDRFEIQELMYRYAPAHDTTDPEAYSALFTEDAVLRAGDRVIAKGRDAIMTMTKNDRARLNPGAVDKPGTYWAMRHLVMNPIVHLNGDGTATGFCYYQVVANLDGVGPQILQQGRYEDEYRKVDGKWLISNRNIVGEMTNPALSKQIGLGGK